MDLVALQVAEGAWLWRRERSRIDKHQSAVLDVGVNAGHAIRPARVARRAAAWRVDNRRAIGRRVVEHVTGAIDVRDVVALNQHGHRNATACVEDARDTPPAQEGPSTREIVERTNIERVTDV